MKKLFALATVAVIGSASLAMAGEGSADLALPVNGDYSSTQPYGASPGMRTTSEVAARDEGRVRFQAQQAPSFEEKLLFDRVTRTDGD